MFKATIGRSAGSSQLAEQRFCVFQIGRVEALGEPAVICRDDTICGKARQIRGSVPSHGARVLEVRIHLPPMASPLRTIGSSVGGAEGSVPICCCRPQGDIAIDL